MSPNYVIVLDKDMDYCRLFRSDSDECPAGEILWQGDNLKVGYEAMIRLNHERRPIPSYHVVRKINDAGRMIFRLFKGSFPKEWTLLHTVHDAAKARETLSDLVHKRNEKEMQERIRMLALLKRAGVDRGKVPPLTDKDKAYLAWLEETGRFEEIAA